jgi:hypothetical protein
MNDLNPERVLDQEHLRLLRLGYLIAGGTSAAVGVFGLVYVVVGGILLTAAMSGAPGPNTPPMAAGLVFGGIGLAIFLGGATLSVVKFLAARALGRRRSRAFCMVAAGLSCLSIPYGTALGILTFIVLSRPSVRDLFAQASA